MSGPSNKDILAWMEIYYTSISGFIFLATSCTIQPWKELVKFRYRYYLLRA